MLKAGAHLNKELQDLYNTYGAETVHFEIIDRCDESFHSERLVEIKTALNAKLL